MGRVPTTKIKAHMNAAGQSLYIVCLKNDSQSLGSVGASEVEIASSVFPII